MTEFETEVELVPDGKWVFAPLPEPLADEIEDLTRGRQGGFGSVRVEVTLGPTTWRTSLFPMSHYETFVLPVKRACRVAAGVEAGDVVRLRLRLVDV